MKKSEFWFFNSYIGINLKWFGVKVNVMFMILGLFSNC